MEEQQTARTLVKSPPELWAQCSDPASLARHLSGFGEIRITRLEPESTVAWEGESVSGTVTLVASGWGTRVQLTAAPPASEAPVDLVPTPVPPILVLGQPALVPRGLSTLFGGLMRRRRETAATECESATEPARRQSRPPTPETGDSPDLVTELEAALDSLGQAHHRPYSRG